MDANIQKTLENSSEIIKSRSSIVPSIIILATAILLGVAMKLIHLDKDNDETPILFITGILILASWGGFSVLSRKTVYVKQSSNQKIIFKTINIDINDKEKIKQFLNDGNISLLKSIQLSDKDALQLHLAYAPDNSLCLAQLSVFVPYEYVNASTVVKFSPEKTVELRAHFIGKE